jgi:hypothetical protein
VIRRIEVKSEALSQKKHITKNGLVEWLKV